MVKETFAFEVYEARVFPKYQVKKQLSARETWIGHGTRILTVLGSILSEFVCHFF